MPDRTQKIAGKNQKLIVSALLTHERLSMLQINQATDIPTRSLASSLGHAVETGILSRTPYQGSTVYTLTEAGKLASAGVALPATKPVTKPAHLKIGTSSSKLCTVPARRLIRSVFDLADQDLPC